MCTAHVHKLVHNLPKNPSLVHTISLGYWCTKKFRFLQELYELTLAKNEWYLSLLQYVVKCIQQLNKCQTSEFRNSCLCITHMFQKESERAQVMSPLATCKTCGAQRKLRLNCAVH
jgi:hypothetical protein